MIKRTGLSYCNKRATEHIAIPIPSSSILLRKLKDLVSKQHSTNTSTDDTKVGTNCTVWKFNMCAGGWGGGEGVGTTYAKHSNVRFGKQKFALPGREISPSE